MLPPPALEVVEHPKPAVLDDPRRRLEVALDLILRDPVQAPPVEIGVDLSEAGVHDELARAIGQSKVDLGDHPPVNEPVSVVPYAAEGVIPAPPLLSGSATIALRPGRVASPLYLALQKLVGYVACARKARERLGQAITIPAALRSKLEDPAEVEQTRVVELRDRDVLL